MSDASDSTRRNFLKATAASALATSLPSWGQSQAAKPVAAARVALVIGNAAYRNVRDLVNPLNDARATGEVLKACGFEVVTLVDSPRADMVAAVARFAETLAARRAIGLFYFAGHGLQLDWRNYLLPVDAVIEGAQDVPRQGVEVGSLMAGLAKAANPMNVVILDACRDNPFAGQQAASQKGLSQMDAPPNTLLAYATSPGNTASDGEGSNGLYTEHLVREMRIPEARIEDVFKRVRLGVRRKSAGRQIPWESTSLESDFYFLPPADAKPATEPELERKFDEELSLFAALREKPDVAGWEAYLRRYPSGRFSELAQLSLDRLLAAQGENRIVVPSAEGNPFTSGTSEANTLFHLGDTYTYRGTDLEKPSEVRVFRHRVTAINDTEVVFNDGTLIIDLLGNPIFSGGRRFSPRQDQPTEYAIGKRWVSRFQVTDDDSERGWTEHRFRVAARERLTVPAGTFDCFRVEGRGSGTRGRRRLESSLTYWMAPNVVRRYVKWEYSRRLVNPRGQERASHGERFELLEFKQA